MSAGAISCNQQSLLAQDPINMHISGSIDQEFLLMNEQIDCAERLISQGIL
ncbi:hypothetical protein SynROS8604_01990 [Synechococcus sp. ROS8604]|nr:hypothetical protein SynROS8604_01990 [Synechococcus sp. ROS8604]